MTTEGPLQVGGNNSFSKNHIPTQQQPLYPFQREQFASPGSADQQQSQQQQHQTGSLMRGYSFLADQIYRSVSNPLYKLVRTVEDTVGSETTTKQPEDSFQNGYQGYQTAPSLKFESNGNFEGENAEKMTEQQDQSPHQVHQQQNFNPWGSSSTTGVQQWYPRSAGDLSQPSSEAYTTNNNWPTAHVAQSEASKSETPPPPQSSSPNKTNVVFQHQHQSQPQNRYQQQYFQEWVEANHATTNAVSSATAYYPQQHFDSSTANAGASVSPQINEEVSFPPAGNSSAEPPSCPGCCVPSAATPHQTTVYPDAGTELHNGLCLVDPMRALPRYFTTGLWPPVINPAKLEWNGGPSVTEDDARLLDMNRFYSDGGYRMAGGTATASVYPGYVGGVQDTKDFFFTPSRYSTAGDTVFRHKTEAHRLSVAAAVTAVDCDPQELEAFAERFKQRRIKLGVTQADVGKALGRLNLAGVGSFSQSTICRFESLTLSHNNMLALKPILQAWLDEAEQEAAARQKNPNAYDMEEDDKKRKRTSITDPEKRSLEAFFGIQPRPSSEKIAQIAEKLNLKKNVVRVWFCNQRQKQKRMKFSTVGLLHQVNGM